MHDTLKIQYANSTAEIKKCWKVMSELRPHLSEEEFVPTVTEMIRDGYKLAFIEKNNVAVAAIGFRYLQFLFNGKHIYIDDLTTLQDHRGQGYAGRLLDHVFEYAKANGYRIVTLDSGFHRHEAHRLYLNKGFQISSIHFSKTVTS